MSFGQTIILIPPSHTCSPRAYNGRPIWSIKSNLPLLTGYPFVDDTESISWADLSLYRLLYEIGCRLSPVDNTSLHFFFEFVRLRGKMFFFWKTSKKLKDIKTTTNPMLPRASYGDLRWNLCLWYLVSKRFFIWAFMHFIMDFEILLLFMHNAQNTRKWLSTERR